MNFIHFLIDYIKGLNPASQWSSSGRDGRKNNGWDQIEPIKQRGNKPLPPKVQQVLDDLNQTSANLVWEKQSNGAWELRMK